MERKGPRDQLAKCKQQEEASSRTGLLTAWGQESGQPSPSGQMGLTPADMSHASSLNPGALAKGPRTCPPSPRASEMPSTLKQFGVLLGILGLSCLASSEGHSSSHLPGQPGHPPCPALLAWGHPTTQDPQAHQVPSEILSLVHMPLQDPH